jgi:iron complex transport system substrate-binding protein
MLECQSDRPRRLVPSLLLCAALAGGVLPGCDRGVPGGKARALMDGLGHVVRLPQRPRRIVSLAPSVTDSLLALGARDRLVGVTDFCVLPPGDAPIARVGGMLNPNLETIRDLRPDVLVATTSGNDPSLAREAASLGLPLYTIDTPDVESVLRSLLDLGLLIDEPERGQVLVADLRSRLSAVASGVALDRPVKVLFVVWGDPLVVPGRTSFLTDALARAGGSSITSDAPAAYPTFDVESAIVRAPEAILTTPQNRAVLDRLRAEPAWSRVPAVRTGSLFVVSELIEQPGPKVVSGIEEVARRLHPDVFAAPKAAAPGAPSGRRRRVSINEEAVRAGGPHGGGIGGGHPSARPQCSNCPTLLPGGPLPPATSGASMQQASL